MIQMFLVQKINAGAVYLNSEYILKEFDSFVASQFPEKETITIEIFNAWLNSLKDNHNNTVNRKIPVIRQLSCFLSYFFPNTYQVPYDLKLPRIQYQPHLITKKELKAFFYSVDHYQPKCNPNVAIILKLIIPVFFRLLYACGLRSSEALFLRRGDVNLDTGKVTIRESKGHKLRIIFLHPELLKLCQEYDIRMDNLCPAREPFFSNEKNSYFSRSSVDRWFHYCWDSLPESKDQKGAPFTPHSFRHNFALTVLNRWYREGLDLNIMLPYLAEFMGHTNLEALNYYLHLSDDFSTEIERVMQDSNEFILPEV